MTDERIVIETDGDDHHIVRDRERDREGGRGEGNRFTAVSKRATHNIQRLCAATATHAYCIHHKCSLVNVLRSHNFHASSSIHTLFFWQIQDIDRGLRPCIDS